jgi:hypothetical protein
VTAPTRPEPASGTTRDILRSSATRRGGLFSAVVLASLLGCAETPEVTAEGGSAARKALVEQAAKGSVRAVVHGTAVGLDPDERDALVTRAMAQGVSGISVRFTTDPASAAAPDPFLVVVLNPMPSAPATLACRRPDAVPTATPAGPALVLAAFCREGEPIGSARGATETPITERRQLERLLWRVAGELFPDDYAETYGLGILPRGINLGVGGSAGF